MALFYSVRQLEEMEMERSVPLWRQILLASAEESGISPEQSLEKMNAALDAMISADEGYDPGQLSHSRLIGGDAERMRQYVERGDTICGDFVGRVLTGAIRMGECNACMHRIVAAPTAGACGVMPAVLLSYAGAHGTSREKLIAALYIAAGFGMVIASRASMSGAEAGCQAEIGTASAMAAAALVYLHGGNVQQMSSAVAIALKNMMGLACDPVAGLVEVPCVKRNAAGAMNALGAAEMALAGIRSRIPADEVIDAMRSVGELMSPLLKETGRGGVAASPTAVRFRNGFFGKVQE